MNTPEACPHCGSNEIGTIAERPQLGCECRACGRRFGDGWSMPAGQFGRFEDQSDGQDISFGVPNCPKCGSGKVLPILWGMPDSESLQRINRGELISGGCRVYGVGDPRDPAFECRNCQERFGNYWAGESKVQNKGKA